MRAAVYRRFGGPEVVRVEEVVAPTPGPGELLIRVHASTVSAADYRARTRIVPRGLALPVAFALGTFRPRRRILGMDISGTIETVGAGVTNFAPGNEVVAMLGSSFGGHAEFVRMPADGAIARKPKNLSHSEAVAVVFGGITALAFLERVTIRPGTTILVNGASGAVGTAAVQLAANLGALVTAVCSGANVELVTSLGAGRVVDYQSADFAAQNRRYDVIMDCVGNAPYRRVEASLNPGGALLLVVADLASILGASRITRSTGKLVTAAEVSYTAAALRRLVRAAEADTLRPVIDRTYDLTGIVEAHRYVETGHKKGSVVLRIADPSIPTPREENNS